MHKFGPDHVSSVCHVKEFGFYPKRRKKRRESRKKTRVRKKEKALKIFKQGSDMIQSEHSDYYVKNELEKDMTESLSIRQLE